MATVTNSNVAPSDFIMKLQTEEDGTWHWANHISKLNSEQQTKLFTGSPVLIYLGVKKDPDGRHDFYTVYIKQREDGKLHYGDIIDKHEDHPRMTKETVQRFEIFLNSPTPTPIPTSTVDWISASSSSLTPAIHFLLGNDS